MFGGRSTVPVCKIPRESVVNEGPNLNFEDFEGRFSKSRRNKRGMILNLS